MSSSDELDETETTSINILDLDKSSNKTVKANQLLQMEDMLKMQKSFESTIDGVQNCTILTKDLIQKIKTESCGDGMSFLHMKNNLLIDYLMNLTLLMANKTGGLSISEDPTILRLVETRTVLEKIRPIDQKLKYQIDKLVKAAVEGKSDFDPLGFKANPDELDRGCSSGEDNEDDQAGSRSKEKTKSEVYRPPKVAPQHFDDEEERGAKHTEKVKRKTINRALIRELQEEFLDTPIEVHNLGDAYAKQLSQEKRDKQRYEEAFMTRLPMTKQDKHKESKMSTLGALGDELTDFSRKRRSAAASGGGSSKSKKRKQNKKGGKKKFRK